MNKNSHEKRPTRAEYQAQQDKKHFFSKLFKHKAKKSASDENDDDFLVFGEENEKEPEREYEPTSNTEDRKSVV